MSTPTPIGLLPRSIDYSQLLDSLFADLLATSAEHIKVISTASPALAHAKLNLEHSFVLVLPCNDSIEKAWFMSWNPETRSARVWCGESFSNVGDVELPHDQAAAVFSTTYSKMARYSLQLEHRAQQMLDAPERLIGARSLWETVHPLVYLSTSTGSSLSTIQLSLGAEWLLSARAHSVVKDNRDTLAFKVTLCSTSPHPFVEVTCEGSMGSQAQKIYSAFAG